MRSNVSTLLCFALALAGCGSRGAETRNPVDASDDCTLVTIVRELVAADAVDCSQQPDEGTAPARVQCILDAQAVSRDAFWISALTSGTDSLVQRAMIVKAGGETSALHYDSHPGGGGVGADTVSSQECESFATSPSVVCEDASAIQYICSAGRRVN
jgi:hypothetical protein